MDEAPADPRDEWHFGGRWYLPALASSDDALCLEVEDVAPAPGRGVLFDICRADATGDLTMTVWTDEPLPFELVEQAVRVAREQLL